MRVFISYGHDVHATLAEKLSKDLKARGHEVWFDLNRLKPGSDFEAYIEEGLNWVSESPESARLILLMTPHSVRRPDGYCLNEMARAITRSLLIIPVMVVWCEPPLSICRIQWLDMQDCIPVPEQHEKYEQKLGRLIEALELGKLDFEGNQTRLFHALKPLNFSAHIAYHVQNFTGRKWVFDSIDNWLASPNISRIFWITGDPGVGKTAIAAYLCHKRSEVAAFHLCQYGHEDKADPQRCVLSLAYQLSSQLPEYHDRLLNILGDLNKSAATLFDNLIVQPLAPPFTSPGHPVLIVIDGLDEATRSGKNELAEFIAKEFPRTPSWLRLVITSRADNEIIQAFQGLLQYPLEKTQPANLKNIADYLNMRLPLKHDHPGYQQIVDTLVEKSEGLFLYVERVLVDLNEGRLSLDQINAFPQGLGGVFYQFFLRQFPDVASYKQRYRPLLEMVIAAREPLPLKLAQTSLEWDDYEMREALNALGSLFPCADAHVQPFHRSIIDWLANAGETGPKPGPYYVNVKDGHKRLADMGWNEYRTGIEKMSPYYRAHLPSHLMELGRWHDLLLLVSCPELKLIANWIDKGESDKGIACLTGLITYLEEKDHTITISAGLATQVARIYCVRGQYDEAQLWLSYALKRSSWWRGRRVYSIALHEQGSLCLYQRDFNKAARLYRTALRMCLWGVPIYHDEAAANMIGLATIYQAKYAFKKTLRFAARGIREARRVGDYQHLVAGERLIGTAYRSLGKYDKAAAHIDTASSVCDTMNLEQEKIQLLLLKGWILYDQAALEEKSPLVAKEYFKQALDKAQSVQNFYCIIESKLSLGLCSLVEKNPEEAESIFFSLYDGFPQGMHLELQAGFYFSRGAISYQRSDYEQAKKLYLKTIEFCDQNKIRTWKYKALTGLGALCWHSGKHEQADKEWEYALRIAAMTSEAKRKLTEKSIKHCKADPMATPQ